MGTVAGQLASWHDTPTTSAITGFVARVTRPGGTDFVAPEQRVAVFDNDGTLWCEKPAQIEIGFVLQRLAAIAQQDPTLRDQQPWRAAYAQDHAWLGEAVTKHYAGDDSDLRLLLSAIPRAFTDQTVEEYAAQVQAFFQRHQHPSLHRPYLACGYRPMVELLRYLEGNGFTTYIASGGDRDFMRPVASTMYGIPPERVIGSSLALEYRPGDGAHHGASVLYKSQMDFFDDGPTKPVRIWSRIGRRPILAAGNANGDLPMLEFTGGPDLPALRLLVAHDDAEREFAYTAGAEQARAQAEARQWTVISVRHDWRQVFAAGPAAESTAPGNAVAPAA